MKKTLKRSLSLVIAIVTVCLTLSINASAYSYVDREVTFTCYQGYKGYGQIGYSTSEGSENWFFGKTNTDRSFQMLGVILYCRGWGESLHQVAKNYYEKTDGSYKGIYVDHEHHTFPLTTYSYHEVGAYDCGYWHINSAYTEQG